MKDILYKKYLKLNFSQQIVANPMGFVRALINNVDNMLVLKFYLLYIRLIFLIQICCIVRVVKCVY